MNTRTHRLIFSRACGCMMAVAETAKSSSKASGESRKRTTPKSKHHHARKPHTDWPTGRLWLQDNTDKACRPMCFLKPSKNQLGSDPHLPSCATLASVMQVDSFDVFQITPRQGAVTFQSTVAPTTVNGVPNTTGGATQTLVLDRNQFTPPVKTGSVKVGGN